MKEQIEKHIREAEIGSIIPSYCFTLYANKSVAISSIGEEFIFEAVYNSFIPIIVGWRRVL